jgi:glutathione S-transferase
MILLEQAQADYQLQMVKLTQGEHKKPEFLAINPKGKVPALKVDNEILTENPAIISLIDSLFPAANLLPKVESKLAELQQLSDLCFCSSTLHPIVTRLCKPEFFTEQQATTEIKQKANKDLLIALQWVEQRLGDSQWWYGQQWSTMDAYIFWVVSRAASCDLDLSLVPNIERHKHDMLKREAVQRALAKEQTLS